LGVHEKGVQERKSMTETHSIIIKMLNGDTMTFKEGVVAHFQFMTQGVFFVEGPVEVTKKQPGLILDEVKYRNVRNWIPIVNIKIVEIITNKVINQPDEIRKWEKFKEHNIDIMLTDISHTEPPDPKDVAKQIAKEEKKKRSVN
jgi:hypothetical protein